MSDLAGMTREDCATACGEKGCTIGNAARCCHPLKGGPPIDRLNDPSMLVAYAQACSALGVANYLEDGATA